MGRLLLFLAIASVAAGGRAEAQQQPSVTTKGRLNGRMWLRMGLLERLSWISGYREGIGWRSLETIAFCECKADLGKNDADSATTGELAEEMNKFYEDSANVRIPLGLGFAAVAKRIGGTPPAEYEKMVAGFRLAYANAPD